jgi:SpoVK/Ycf46/Vps4 family AAA+-type ATPase
MTTDPTSDVTALLKARHTLIWVVSREEARVENALIDAAAAAKYPVAFWDCATGLSDATGKVLDASMVAVTGGMPPSILDRVRDRPERMVYVLRDLAPHLRDPFAVRALRSLARSLQKAPKNEARAIVVLTPSSEVPLELQGHATLVEWPLPARADIGRIFDDVVSALPEGLRDAAVAPGVRDAAIDAAVGLSAEEASNCYARSLVSTRRIEPAIVAAEKKRVIARGKGVTWEDPDPRGLDAVGGLDNVKSWLTARKAAFGPRARAYGLPAPKGCFLVGLPGTGKTLVSRCIAAAWGLPLISLDFGALQSKFVGESQTNLRQTLSLIEAVSPCVVRVDEIEKALAGASGPAADGGVSQDALGTFLTWMQERRSPSFVIATANDVRNLPPELLRKGRFDEVFFVDLPTRGERAAIVRAALGAHNRAEADVDVDAVADATVGFSGAEIAALVPDALFVAFADGEREIGTADLLTAAATVVPLSKTAAEKIEALRSWAKGRARFASRPEDTTTTTGAARALDL